MGDKDTSCNAQVPQLHFYEHILQMDRQLIYTGTSKDAEFHGIIVLYFSRIVPSISSTHNLFFLLINDLLQLQTSDRPEKVPRNRF